MRHLHAQHPPTQWRSGAGQNSPRPRHRHRLNGFTLIEVLVAISVMALMSLMTWRGIDGMLRTQSGLQTRADDIRTLQAGLAQWQTDLDQSLELPGTPGWDWNGQVLRLTRRANTQAESVQVVAWTWRIDPGRPGGGDWQRWQSSPLSLRSDWQAAWRLAEQWGQTPDPQTRAAQVNIHPLGGWQIFVHRGGDWTNPLSNAAVNPGTAPPAPAASSTPDGVRLILNLPQGPAGAGLLTLDWVRPTLSGGLS
ncbi:MAG: PulJ/GspJ family protein [Limnohabitans sp.]